MTVEPEITETPETAAPVGPERTVDALAWAGRVAVDPETAGPRPPRPTAEEIRAVPLSVLREHLDDLLVKRNVEEALQALYDLGILDVWLPEVAGMVGFGDGEWRHKDVWKHTKQVVRQSVPRLEVRWGALLHDIGKPKTRRIGPKGEVTFYGHSEVGAAMYRKKVRKRLGFEGHLGDRIHFLILHHLRASQYDASWTDSAVRRFYKQMGEGLKDLLDLSRADITTKRPERRRRGVRQISALSKRIQKLKELDAQEPPLPKGLGTLIIEELGVPPSKRLGDLIKALEADVEAGEIDPGLEAEAYVAHLRANAERFDL